MLKEQNSTIEPTCKKFCATQTKCPPYIYSVFLNFTAREVGPTARLTNVLNKILCINVINRVFNQISFLW